MYRSEREKIGIEQYVKLNKIRPHLCIIIREKLQADYLCINTALKLHGEVTEVITPHPGLVDACGKHVLAVT